MNWDIFRSDNGLSPVRCQAIIWTNAGLLSIGPLGTILSEILIKIQQIFTHKNAYENIVCEMAAILSRGRWVNVLIDIYHVVLLLFHCCILLELKLTQGSFCVCVCPANKRWRYIVTSSLIGWAHSQNDLCLLLLYTVSIPFQTIWQYKRNMSLDFRFDMANQEVCKDSLDAVSLEICWGYPAKRAMVKLYFLCWNYSLSSGWHIIAA